MLYFFTPDALSRPLHFFLTFPYFISDITMHHTVALFLCCSKVRLPSRVSQ